MVTKHRHVSENPGIKTIQELVCSYFSEEQFTLSQRKIRLTRKYLG